MENIELRKHTTLFAKNPSTYPRPKLKKQTIWILLWLGLPAEKQAWHQRWWRGMERYATSQSLGRSIFDNKYGCWEDLFGRFWGWTDIREISTPVTTKNCLLVRLSVITSRLEWVEPHSAAQEWKFTSYFPGLQEGTAPVCLLIGIFIPGHTFAERDRERCTGDSILNRSRER